MLRFVVRRLLLLVPILLGLSILLFFWVRALPGGPAEALLGERATPELLQQYKELYGLDEPLYEQYAKYLQATVVDRDLGVSVATHRTVTEEISERFPATVELAFAAMLFAVLVGVPLGFFAAKRYGGLFDQASLFLSLIGISVPIFVLAILLKYIFAVRLGWLPSVGRIDLLIFEAKHPTNFYVLDAILTRDWSTLWDVLKHLILPAVALGSIPLAIILKYVFAVRLAWLPSVGRIDLLLYDAEHPTNFYVLDAILTRDWAALWDVLKHLILPAIALGSIPLAIVARITRAAVLDVQNEDYVRTARAKGVKPSIVDSRHVFRNALLPVTTVVGLQTGLLLSGAILTETVFAFPGMGAWLREAIFNRDYPVLQGGILFLATIFVLVNLIVDVLYAVINPRIRYS
jgi:peptide/nickel transport system permease protein